MSAAVVPLVLSPGVRAVEDAGRRFRQLGELAARRRSARLRLRPIALEDAAALWTATRHPDFNTWLTWRQPADREALQARVERLVAQDRAHQSCLLSALEVTSGRWVGLYRMAPDLWKAAEGWFELGMWLHPDCWGGGWAAELHARGTSLAFEGSDAPGLSARTAEANVKAWRTLERMGFEYTGACDIGVEDALPHRGRLYRLDRAAWERATAPGAAA